MPQLQAAQGWERKETACPVRVGARPLPPVAAVFPRNSFPRLAFGVGVCLNLCIALVFLSFILPLVSRGLDKKSDFTPLYTGWLMVREGRGAQLYEPAVQRAVQRDRVIPGYAFPDLFKTDWLPYLNPPHMSAPFAPLTLLPLREASQLWAALQLILIGYAFHLLWRLCANLSLREKVLLLSCVAALYLWWYTIMLGAFSILLLICLLKSYAALRNDRDFAAGVWLAVLTLKPQLIVLPVLLLLVSRRRAFYSFVLTFGALVALSVVLYGWRVWLSWLNLVARDGSATPAYYAVFIPAMPNLRGVLWTVWGAHHEGGLMALCYVALACGALAVLWLGRKRLPFDLSFGFAIVLGLFLSPHCNPQDMLMLIVPALICYQRARTTTTTATKFELVLACYPLIYFLCLLLAPSLERLLLWSTSLGFMLLLACSTNGLWTHYTRGRKHDAKWRCKAQAVCPSMAGTG